MAERVLVALFKGEKCSEENDPYCEALRNAGFAFVVIPTLTFDFVNLNNLEKCLQQPADFSGIIFTSTRSVEAVHKRLNIMENNIKVTSYWKSKRNYSVGESTAESAKKLLDFDTQGKDSGSSEKLCNFILGSDPVTKPFLFPCSNIRKDTIPETLSQNGFPVEEIISYKTMCNPDLKAHWQKIVSELGLPRILIFFSPSGVNYSHQLIKDTEEEINSFKFVAIGPSTEKALHEVGLVPCEVAKKPSATAVCEAVKNVMTS